MKILKVLPARYWQNSKDGRRVSIASIPWPLGSDQIDEWTVVEDGYTFEKDNGTTGTGHVPFQSEGLAGQFMAAYNCQDWNRCRALRDEDQSLKSTI